MSARWTAAIGAAIIAFSAIFVKLSHASDSTAAIFRCFDASLILVPLAWAEQRRFGPRPWRARRAGLAAGVFFAADLVMWDRAITDVGAGLATVLANVQVILVPLVAWALLREAPGRRVLAALGPVLLGVLLISGVLVHGAYGTAPLAGAALGAGAGLAYVGALLLLRHGGADLSRPVAPLAEMTASATVVAALIGIVLGDARFVPVWPGAAWLALLAVGSQVIGWLAITRSLPRLPAATTSLLLMIQPIGSLLLGALLLGERPSASQLLGVALLLGAVVYATRPAGPVSGTGPAPRPGSAGRPRDRPRHRRGGRLRR
ncbi:DMT family transporter [Conexibacter sp. DBS9H8]|uniref:DMT family transporter n=1 Tax=Conexibacter sp. DBS9H8 TaxID=2937801 RepID=UPI00200E6C0A|nr:DMT family transporter [Conexibacter sp. DBS9H8]